MQLPVVLLLIQLLVPELAVPVGRPLVPVFPFVADQPEQVPVDGVPVEDVPVQV